MLIDDYKYFDGHRHELARQYPDMWLIIKDRKILFAVNSLKEALDVSYGNGMKEGDCLIHFCRKDGKKKIAKVGRIRTN